MRIGIDLARYRHGSAGGIAVLLQEIVHHLPRLFPQHRYFIFGTPASGALAAQGSAAEFYSLPTGDYLEELDALARRLQLDVLLRSYPQLGRWTFPLARQVFLIPDMLHEDHPEFFTPEVLRGRRLDFNQALTCAGALVTISEFSRSRLLDQPNALCRDVAVVAPCLPAIGAGEWRADGEVNRAAREPYFFYPANHWPHKNHARLLEAFRLFCRRWGKGRRLLLSGHAEDWSRLKLQGRGLPIEHVGYVPRPHLVRLMAGARALAFFSLYEGFGMPLLEAFAARTPVVCSAIPALREVGGDAVLTCDPTDPEAMCELLTRVDRDAELRDTLVGRGAERLGQFSWTASIGVLEATLRRTAERATRPIDVETPPLVSIVTPSFAQGRFLKRTIDSVLGQDYPHIEYQVVDGGSRDGSVAILRSYGERLRWVCEPDRGQSHAINKGFAHSRGSLRAYVNSDDVLLPGAVATAVDYFRSHPDWDVLFGRAYHIDEDDRILQPYPTEPFSFPRLVERCMICQPAAFWRRGIAERVGPLDENLHFAMDYDYWMRIDRAGGRIEGVPEYLAHSRWHPRTKTLSRRRDVYREIFEVSLRHAGYAGAGHYLGYWLEECDRLPGLSWLKSRPRLLGYLVRLHSRWQRSGGRLGPFCRDASLALLRKIGNRILANEPCQPDWTDGVVGPSCMVPLSRLLTDELYLAGTAPRRTTLTVRVGKRVVETMTLEANEPQVIRIRLPEQPEPILQLEFSHHALDRQGREVAFEVEQTNLR